MDLVRAAATAATTLVLGNGVAIVYMMTPAPLAVPSVESAAGPSRPPGPDSESLGPNLLQGERIEVKTWIGRDGETVFETRVRRI